MKKLTAYQEVIHATALKNPEQIKEVLQSLLEKMNLVIVKEQTPDYTTFTLENKNDIQKD